MLAVLGQNFEDLTGDQVLTRDDGTKELVAISRYPWPSPQCGGDPLPLFGGADCQPQQEQLQGDYLPSAMIDVMGTITQARMCDFWGIELPPSVEGQHPWPAFAQQWREWFLNPPKDFSDAQSNSGWTQEPVTWHLVKQQGDRYFVDITDHDQVIISLEVDRVGVKNSTAVACCPARLILGTRRLQVETHRCPPQRCGARMNTTP